MYPAVPAEMISGAAQLALYFVAALGALLGFMLSGRG